MASLNMNYASEQEHSTGESNSAMPRDDTEGSRSSKRKRDTAPAMDGENEVVSEVAVKQPRNNAASSNIIGIELTDGRVLYCSRSTLVNAGGYFSTRFGNNGIGEGESFTDERGRKIYFLERDGKLFENHILPYIVTKKPGDLPPFSEAPRLWRLLRQEADFYALDGLSEILHITHSCPYNAGNDRGVLHWLGTSKGTREYQNPQAIGAVAVHVGRLGDMTFSKRDDTENDVLHPEAFTQESRQALVQYKPPILGYDEERTKISIGALQKCYSLWCNLSCHHIPTIVDLRKITLRLTAYSLRYDQHGMTHWSFEGSEDCSQWTALHVARNDQNIAKPDPALTGQLASDLGRCSSQDAKVKISQEFADRELSHTWKITPPNEAFFRYFRIIGVGPDYQHGENASTCLHGVGLELFGDVYED